VANLFRVEEGDVKRGHLLFGRKADKKSLSELFVDIKLQYYCSEREDRTTAVFERKIEQIQLQEVQQNLFWTEKEEALPWSRSLLVMAICIGAYSFLLGLTWEPDSPSEETARLRI